jgi:hypothetical protein
VTAVEGGLNVEWTPASPNGRAITAYTITVTPADVEEIVVGGSATSVTIEDLNPEVTYRVTVRATNLRGQGDAGVSTASIQPLTVAYRQQVDTGDRDAGDDAASHGLVRIVSAGPCAAPTSAAPTAPGAGVEDAAPGPTPGEGTTGSADSSADEEASTADTGQADRQTRPSTAGGPTQPGVTEPEEEEAAAEEESAAAPAGGPSGDPDPAAPESAAPEPITDASTRNSSTLILVVLALLLVGVGVLAVMRRESGPLGEVG